MQIEGTLKTWNDDRGFGFITPAQGGQEVFVHVSAFPRDGRRPAVDERLFFEIALNRDGKKQAVKVRRPARPSTGARPNVRHPLTRDAKPHVWSGAIAAALVAGLGFYGYKTFLDRPPPLLAMQPGEVAAAAEPLPAPTMRCDSRKHCSQMTSCSEAKYFLKNCPGVMMDGDRDGTPCEEQWCTSPFSR